MKSTSNSSSNSPKQYIPQINFSSLDSLSQDEIEKIKRRGSVLIRDVVDDAQAVEWKNELKEFVKVNDERGVEGIHSQFKRTPIYIKSH
jgi:hypothetical protein